MQDVPLNQILIAGAAVLAILFFTLRGQQKKRQVKAALAEGAKVIDVRSPSEFGEGHYNGAINIPHDKIADKLKTIGPVDTPIVVYCASGARSSMAAQTLKAKGYTRVVNAGGYGAMPS